MEIQNIEVTSNKWIACVILHLLRLLYHTTVNGKGISAGAILSATHAVS